jgi:hypothetical protein
VFSRFLGYIYILHTLLGDDILDSTRGQLHTFYRATRTTAAVKVRMRVVVRASAICKVKVVGKVEAGV